MRRSHTLHLAAALRSTNPEQTVHSCIMLGPSGCTVKQRTACRYFSTEIDQI
jgi:hypothetical protein